MSKGSRGKSVKKSHTFHEPSVELGRKYNANKPVVLARTLPTTNKSIGALSLEASPPIVRDQSAS